MKINFCSAPPGSGKTHQVSNRSRNLAEGCNKVLILQPTRDLLEKTAEEEIRPFPFRIFHKGKVDGSVAKALADYVAEVPDDVQEVLLATHQVLPHIKNFANKDKSSSSGMIRRPSREKSAVSKASSDTMPSTFALCGDWRLSE